MGLKNPSLAELSKLRLNPERSCRDSRAILLEASANAKAGRHLVAQFDGFRLFRFRIVRRVRLNELRVLRWMRTCVVREFFEDVNRDRLSRRCLQLRRTRLLNQKLANQNRKLGRREQSLALSRRRDQSGDNHEYHGRSRLKLPARLVQTIRHRAGWLDQQDPRE